MTFSVRPLHNALERLAGLLSRRTSSGGFVPEIDGFRFVAIFLVIAFHAPFHHSPGAPALYVAFASRGSFGVQLFFALSGFILSLPFAQHFRSGGKSVRLGKYYSRRLTRLEPPYIVNLLIFFVALVAVKRHDVAELARHLLASLSYQHNLVYHSPSTINSFTWSLEIEAQFYLVAPLLALVFSIDRSAVRRAVLGLAVVAPIVIRRWLHTPDLFLFFPGQVEWFACGFLLTELQISGYLSATHRSRFWDAVAVGGWPLLIAILWEPSLLCAVIRPGLVVVLYVAGFLGPRTRRLLTARPIYLMGGMCYSTYLYHGLVLGRLNPIVDRLMTQHSWALIFVVGFPALLLAVYAVSVVAFVFVEKPFMTMNVSRRPTTDADVAKGEAPVPSEAMAP